MFETVSPVLIATTVTIDNANTGCNMNSSLERLKSVQRRIEKACFAAGRQPEEVSLLAVSKRQSAEKIITFNNLGLISFGENQLQEALEKQGVVREVTGKKRDRIYVYDDYVKILDQGTELP